MGLLDARNIKKAKGLLDKNRHKVGSIVGKATDQVDKLSKGKTSAVTSKIDKAAMKFSHGSATEEAATDETATDTTTTDETTTDTTTTDEAATDEAATDETAADKTTTEQPDAAG